MKKKKEEGNVLVFHVFIHLSVYSSVHPSVRPLCLIVFGGRERERETCAYCRAVAGSIQWLLYLSFICSGLHYYCYSTVYTHTHTPPFFFRSFFFCWCAWRMLFTSRYIIAISSFLPSPSILLFFFFLIYFFLFIYLFIYFFYSGGLFSLCSPSRLGTCSYTDKPIDKQEQQYKRVQRYNVRFLFHRRRRKRGR